MGSAEITTTWHTAHRRPLGGLRAASTWVSGVWVYLGSCCYWPYADNGNEIALAFGTAHCACASVPELMCTEPRGRQKKIDGPPSAFAKSQTHPPTIRHFFFLTFFFSTFLGVSRQGEFKNTIKIFWQKVRVENFSQNFDKNFDVSFSSTFFVLSHFRVFFSDGS